ncbi:unnamed protein product, partial [Owenia fusiformis]
MNNSTWNNSDSGPTYYSPIIISLQIILGTLMIFTNSLVIMAVKRYKKLQTVSNLFRTHLAASDITFGSMLVLRALLASTGYLDMPYVCLFILIILITSGCATATGIFLLWLESFLLTKRSHNHQGAFSKRTATKMIFATWGIWTVYGFLSLAFLNDRSIDKRCLITNGYNEYFLMSLSIITAIHIFILIGIQIATFKMLSRHIKRLTKKGVIPPKISISYVPIKHNRITPVSERTVKATNQIKDNHSHPKPKDTSTSS